MQKNKIISAVVSLVAFATIGVGCATQQPQTTATQTPQQTNQTAEQPTNQPEKIYKIGITQYAPHPSLDNCREGFIQGLKQEGFEEGKNISFQIIDAQGDSANTSAIAQKFVADKVDLICAIATPSAQGAANAIAQSDIPLVFNAITDPVQAGLVLENGKGAGNITGVSDKMPVKKQLELIKTMLPNAKTIGIIHSTSEINSETQIADYKAHAKEFGFEIVTVGITDASEIAAATESILPKVDCIQNMTDNTVVSAMATIIAKAQAANKPVFGSEIEQVKNGCVAAQGVEYFELGISCAKQAARILRGEKASEIPFETVEKSDLFLNSEKLEKLKITVSDELLKSAKEIY